jgi:CrcB protein
MNQLPAWMIVVILMVGGGVGTNARYWLGKLVVQIQGNEIRFPWGTFIINVTGSAILGLAAMAWKNHPDDRMRAWYLLLGTGFCGGYTTFSTFSYETLELIQGGKSWIAVVYLVASVAAGLLGAWTAVRLAG